MNLFSLLLCALSLFASIDRAAAAELDPILAPEVLWDLKPETLPQQTGRLGFRWNSEQRDSARSAMPGLTFLGQRVYEVVALFDGDTLKSATILLYRRGDAGDM